jgi:phosphoglycolate phosphatase
MRILPAEWLNMRLLVFDLDGTLVDSHRDLADATNALLVELGAAPLSTEAVAAMVGEGAAVLVRRALSRAGLPPDTPGALDRFLHHYDRRLLATTRPYEGMVETLDALRARRHALAVLTNKPQAASLKVLRGLAFDDRFTHVVGGDTTHGRKPDPSGLLWLIAEAGVSAAETMLIGDSPVDLATARNAGAAICLARYGFGYRFGDGDFDGRERFISSPAELLVLLAGPDA